MTNMSEPVKKLTLRDRKKAQPKAVVFFSEPEKTVIKDTIGKNLTQEQFKIFVYTSQALGLNPLLNEIACVTYKDKDTGLRTMSIQVMRDGFLTIAHRSGKFAGLESGVTMSEDGKTIINGWAKVYHKDFTVPVYQEADFGEYNTNRNLWLSKPKTMIKKVAESMALRKAFNINGVYAPEEMEKELVPESPKVLEVKNGDSPASEEQIATIKALSPKGDIKEDITKQEASEIINQLSQKK
jgi:phage recombination protein Bet